MTGSPPHGRLAEVLQRSLTPAHQHGKAGEGFTCPFCEQVPSPKHAAPLVSHNPVAAHALAPPPARRPRRFSLVALPLLHCCVFASFCNLVFSYRRVCFHCFVHRFAVCCRGLEDGNWIWCRVSCSGYCSRCKLSVQSKIYILQIYVFFSREHLE